MPPPANDVKGEFPAAVSSGTAADTVTSHDRPESPQAAEARSVVAVGTGPREPQAQAVNRIALGLVPPQGIEPWTVSLQMSCSTG